MTWEIGKNATRWLPVLNAAELKYGIPFDLLARQCYQESRFNPDARNPSSGAIGIMQLLAKYFPGAGRDPAADIATAAQYLRNLYKRFSDWQLALAGYNWGPGSLAKWQKAKGEFADLPQETRDYVSEIIADVPIKGVLCKIPSSPSLPSGSLPKPLSVELPSAEPSGKSLWQSVTGIFSTHSGQKLPAPLTHLPLESSPTLSQIVPVLDQIVVVKPKEKIMSTNALEVAAVPTAIAVLQAAKQLFTNLGTDPMQIAARAPGAFAVFIGTIEIQLPGLLNAELGAVQTDINSKIDGLIAKLNAKTAPPLVPSVPTA